MRVALLVRETCSARDAVGRTSALGRGRPEQAVGRLGRTRARTRRRGGAAAFLRWRRELGERRRVSVWTWGGGDPRFRLSPLAGRERRLRVGLRAPTAQPSAPPRDGAGGNAISRGLSIRPSDRRGPGTVPEAAMCVQDVDVQCVLQFTLIRAAGCALHRRASRVIRRSEVYFSFSGFPRVRSLDRFPRRRPASGAGVRATSVQQR